MNGSGPAPTAIVAPLAAELAGVLAAVTDVRPLRRAGDPASCRRRRWWRGRLAGEAVVVAATGDGAAAAAASLEALLIAVRPRRLLVLGVAGGLTPGLAAGTLVAASRVLAEDGSAAPAGPDQEWLARALACGATAGVAVSTDRILGDPEGKQLALRRALRAFRRDAKSAPSVDAGRSAEAAAAAGAPWHAAGGDLLPDAACDPWPAAPDAITADLESVAYARVAAAHSVPYLVVRCVLDPAEETLALDFEACRTAGGGVSNSRVVLRALAHPASLGGLWRLRARLRDAARRLAALAARLVATPTGAMAPARTARAGRGEAKVVSAESSQHATAAAGRR